MVEPGSLRADILELIQRGIHPVADDEFNSLALRSFQFQFETNIPYRKYCERRSVTPDSVRDWLEVPAVPTGAFKEAQLVAGDAARAQAVFRTSGTTRGAERRGAHYVLDLELYERSLLPTFAHFVLQGDTAIPMLLLVPAWHPQAESSLAFMVSTVLRELGTADSIYGMDEHGIDVARVHAWLRTHAAREQPVCLIGTSLAFVHWLEQLAETKTSLQLPAGSRVMDTGGFKGARVTISSNALREQYGSRLGVPESCVINEYGMTEMLSQFYDARGNDEHQPDIKQGPPWVRSAVVDPETLAPLPRGRTGLLRHFDLANLFSVSAIQTEDLGIETSRGFRLLGRAAGAAPRGCSIAMDIFLSSAQR